MGRLDSGGWQTGSDGGEGRSCLAFSVEEGVPKSEQAGRDATGVKDTRLGVGPFGVVVPLGVVGPGVLALLRTLGVEGVRGAMRGWVLEELVGVRWVLWGWGVEGVLVLPDVGV